MRIEVDAASAGARLDALVARVCQVSLRQARSWIEDGAVRLQHGGLAKGRRLTAGDVVEVVPPEQVAAVLQPHPEVPLQVLYEDDHVVAINKPGPLASHPLRSGEGATAAGALIALYPECAEASEDPREGGLGHRLDQGTSGVLIAARSREAWSALRLALAELGCEKTYIAEVLGAAPMSDVVSEAIGRGGPKGGKAIVGGGRDPLPARTEFERLSLRPSSSLVRARLGSGRLHQVRAHLAFLGFPVLGDPLYGDARAAAIADSLGVDGLRLHAESARLRHPMTGRPLTVTAPPPPWAVPDA